jgi:hypothetical protein
MAISATTALAIWVMLAPTKTKIKNKQAHREVRLF